MIDINKRPEFGPSFETGLEIHEIGEPISRIINLKPGEECELDVFFPSRKEYTMRRLINYGISSMRSRFAQAGLEMVQNGNKSLLVNWGSASVELTTQEIYREVQDSRFPRTDLFISNPLLRKSQLELRAGLPNWIEQFFEENPNMQRYLIMSEKKYFAYYSQYWGMVPLSIPIDSFFIMNPGIDVMFTHDNDLASHEQLSPYKCAINSWGNLIDVMDLWNINIVKINGVMPNFSIPDTNYGFILGRAPENTRTMDNTFRTRPYAFGMDIVRVEDYLKLLQRNSFHREMIPHGGSCVFDPGFNTDRKFPGVAEIVLSRSQVTRFESENLPMEFNVPFMVMPLNLPVLN